MVVCHYYLRGQCKFGDACKFEHPIQRSGGFGGSSWTNNNSPAYIPFTQEQIAKDFDPKFEKPLWPLSSYGAAKAEPTIISNLDESPEELRWRAIQALQSGNAMDYQNYEASKIQAANQIYSNALSNANQVYNQARDLAIAAQKGIQPPPVTSGSGATNAQNPSAQGSAFGGQSAFRAGAGTQSAFGNNAGTTSAFGKPAFGQPSFGQPAFGQSAFHPLPPKPVSAFAPAQGTQTTSAFGQPAQSSFIRPAVGFGAIGANSASNPAPSSGGGAFAAFAGGGPSAFGSSQHGPAPPAGQSAFGMPNNGSVQNTDPTAFANPQSAFGAPAPTQPVSAFGQTATPVSAFGPPTSGSSSGAQPVFGQPSQPTSAFSHPQQTTGYGLAGSSPSAFSAFRTQPGINSNTSHASKAPNFQEAISSYVAQVKDKYDDFMPQNYLDIMPAPERQAFESKTFELGKIPNWIPPMQFR